MFNRLFKLFKKKEEKPLEKPAEKKEEVKPPELKVICADDPEAYEALNNTMLVYPRGISVSMKEATEKGDFFTAGQLAIYKGDVEKVKEYFGKYAELSGRKLKILEIPERAVKKAQEYYAKSLKEKEGEKKTV